MRRSSGSFLEWTRASKGQFAFFFSSSLPKEAQGRLECEKAWSIQPLGLDGWDPGGHLVSSSRFRWVYRMKSMGASPPPPSLCICPLHIHFVFLVPKPWHLKSLRCGLGGRLPSFLWSRRLLSILTLPPEQRVLQSGIFLEEDRMWAPRGVGGDGGDSSHLGAWLNQTGHGSQWFPPLWKVIASSFPILQNTHTALPEILCPCKR